MARQSRAENGRRRLAIFKRYGILVDASTELPAKLPPRSEDSASEPERFKSWCGRVLGCDPAGVRVYAHIEATPRMGMKRLRAASPSAGMADVLLAQHQISTSKAEAQLRRAKRKTEAKLAELASEEARLRSADNRLARRTRTSRLESLSADMEKWVDGNPDLDVILQERAQKLLAGLEHGRSVASLIQEVLLFAQMCRTELGRSANGQARTEQLMTR